MTIFSRIVTELLIKGIDEIITSSKNEDVSPLSTARERAQSALDYVNLGFFSVKRNTTLSGLKRKELESLKYNIEQSSTQEQKDDVAYNTLTGYFTASALIINNLCKGKNKNDGTTGTLLTRLARFLQYAYDKICTDLELSNIPYNLSNIDALNCMRYYAAKSSTDYVFDERFYLATQNYQLLHDKEQLIKAELNQAVINVNPPKQKLATKALLIIDRAKAVIEENDRINSRYRFSIGGSKMIPDYVKKYMEMVKTDLSCPQYPSDTNENISPEDREYMGMSGV